MAAFFSEVYCDNKWVKWLSYSFATMTGLSRLNDDKHWASDVVAGAVLGYLVGKYVMKINTVKENRLSMGYGNYGVSLRYSW